ncbi:MAG: methyltransferase domain-containing protein [Methylophaga sp.]|nr:methyltransferase domain-containing protein [Methylophaga sp.]
MTKLLIEAKWDAIYENSSSSEPVEVLLENAFLLPDHGVALDLACGLGGSALFLAEKGLISHAWDISSVALDKLKQKADEKNLKVLVKQIYIDENSLPKNTFDVIVLSHFLDRSLCNAIMDALKPNGLLFYQTYVRDKMGSCGPKNPAFLLARNELLQLFSPLNVLVYRENSLVGNLNFGERNEALFIGQKG